MGWYRTSMNRRLLAVGAAALSLGVSPPLALGQSVQSLPPGQCIESGPCHESGKSIESGKSLAPGQSTAADPSIGTSASIRWNASFGPGGREEAEARRWYNLGSLPSHEDRVVWGMWTTHLNREDDGWQNDRALGVVYHGWYAATFRTTHGPRAISVGLERTWVSTDEGPAMAMVGFRTGLVYGYDERLGWAAELSPVLPFAQPVLYTRIGPFTADVTYTWVVISVTAGLRF